MDVYLIDDDSDEAELFGEAVRRIDMSIHVTAFDNGIDAISAITNGDQKPDIIFLDLNMPLLSGKEILVQLKLDERSSGIPVVIYSTSISEHDVEETSDYGVKSYLQKPENLRTLCEKLRELLLES